MAIDDLLHWLREATGLARAERGRLARHDPWRRLEYEAPLWAFGPGATDEFTSYLQGESRVHARTPDELAQWLLGCRYADDRALLGEEDQWQHPCTFEVVRSGDCEDFALWTWRKLLEARYAAEFIVGVRHRRDGVSGRHAWVVFRDGDDEWLFDAVEPSRDAMIREVHRARDGYEPQVGVGGDGGRFVFAGLYRSEWGAKLVLPRRRR